MPNFITTSEDETKKLAAKFAQTILQQHIQLGAFIIALSGNLGSGKTIFTQGFAQGLGIKNKVLSPSFVLMRTHQIPNSSKKLQHIDLYRLDKIVSLDDLGLNELLGDPDNVIILEWAEKIEKLLPNYSIKITIEYISENSRKITLPAGSLPLA